jgi:hypothetical protein
VDEEAWVCGIWVENTLHLFRDPVGDLSGRSIGPPAYPLNGSSLRLGHKLVGLYSAEKSISAQIERMMRRPIRFP